MKLYTNFIGIDIGKYQFVCNKYTSQVVDEYENSEAGIEKFLKEYELSLKEGLCILETTGGYEMELLLTLCYKKHAVHRANTRQVKSFIRSYGKDAKTDALDAKALARYGYERHTNLRIYEAATEIQMSLYELVMRRHDLKQMIVAEKNRAQAPRTKAVKNSYETVLKILKVESEEITAEITRIIKEDDTLQKKKEILKGIPGIGEIISNELVVLLPELGHLNRKEIASLVGVAPISRDSGRSRGYRATGHGRAGIKPNLFLAAMAASHSHSELKTFYEGLIGRGKKKKVALTAVMRKIITIANARIREFIYGKPVAGNKKAEESYVVI